MRTNYPLVPACVRAVLVATAALGLMTSRPTAQSQVVHLIAAPLTKAITLPNGNVVSVPMWGYALDANANGVVDSDEPVTVPGPRITVPPGTATLDVSLTNTLPEATSLVVPGQAFTAAPVRRDDGRIVSMTAETPPGGTHVYQFTGLRPGTFLYESGTHQAVQVQMGLYGPLTMDTAAGEAYPGVTYDHEALLLYSEIDVALHEAVATGTYGHPDLGGPTSTIKYRPSLFLVNGESYSNDLTAILDGGRVGQRTIVRLLNAGLQTHVPVLDNGTLSIVAEDGHASPFARTQAAILLSAGKTHDAVWTPTAQGTFSLYDRSLNLTAADQGSGGMLAKLRVAAAPTDPAAVVVAADDSYAATEDTPLVVAASGVLANDTGAVTALVVTKPRSGALVLNPDGGFTYTPGADFSGFDTFTYQATNGTDVSQPAVVSISVAAVSDAPVAIAQAVGVPAKDSVHITLTGRDPDGDTLAFYVMSPPPANGTISIVDPVTKIERPLAADEYSTGPGTGLAIPKALVIYTPDPGTPPAPPYSGADAFQFVASDMPTRQSAAADVSVTVHALEASQTPTGNPLALTVVGSDGAAITAYRWTLEEDRTYKVVPGVGDPNTLSVSFHASSMPVKQAGTETTQPIVDPATRYFVSVLPASGYSNGGGQVEAGQTALTVTVNKGPQPTARIRVRVTEDNSPLNGMWDAEERGLPGFEVTIDDAGGRYGMSGGHQSTDAFGNPIGTIYGDCSTGQGTCDTYEVVRAGQGFVLSDADGYAVIDNLPPGKYTVKVRAPGGDTWVQTSTIEGTPGIDAWVKSNEPQFFSEFGPAGPHVEIGMVKATTGAGILGSGAGPFSSITGTITNLHMSRPPDFRLYSGATLEHTRPWVALNSGATGGTLLYTQPVREDGTFQIDGVPSGSYQLVVFDSALDLIIANQVVNVSAPTAAALGDVAVFDWFSHLYAYVFEDGDENGFRDQDERGIPDQALNIRWRDGSMYQSLASNPSGMAKFDEVFPFFAWMVAEVDFTRFKATGVTVVVDNGGDTTINTSWPAMVGAAGLNPKILAPQAQAENSGLPFRTETGSPLILLEGFQGFLGQTSVLLWGKTAYAPTGSVVPDVNVAPFDDFPGPGDTDGNGNGRFDVDVYHGGITGVVHYSTTRAENDPRWGTPEPWEPGVPGVRVQLWDASRTHLLNEVTTDSWDDAQPEGCQGDPFVFRGRTTDCYDGLRVFNQVRPSVFDGGYYLSTSLEPFVDGNGAPLPLSDRTIMKPLTAGNYVVKVIPPDGYRIVKEEDKNVDFGDEYIPQQFYLTGYPLADAGGPADAQPKPTVEEYPLAVPFCVGTEHEVPPTLALFPGTVNGTYGGDKRPLCDAKLVSLHDGANAAANFFLFTEAPVAGHVVGFVLDDTTNEFDPNAPTFGEKYAPPFMPISIRDWTGREIVHTYTDEYGVYNVLVPSTFTAAVPEPSGMSPSMLTACINSPTMMGPNGIAVPDPHFRKEYSHFCYTMQFMPGVTSYLDTPVVPTGAFTGNGSFPVDAELRNKTPVIASVNGTEQNIGPYIVDRGAAVPAARTIVIRSAGSVAVINPAYAGSGSNVPKLITRDYGFGPASPGGFVRLGGRDVPVTSWANDQITAVVPTGVNYRTGELTVERCLTAKVGSTCGADSRQSAMGITLSVATPAMHTARPPKVVLAGAKIQPVIDAAKPGDLILVQAGTYEEMVVMTKPVRLQGVGAPSTVLNIVTTPAETIQSWLDYTGNLLLAHPEYLIPGQPAMTPAPFFPGDLSGVLGGEGAGVTVLGKNLPTNLGICLGTFATPANEAYCQQNENTDALPARRPNARVDGFSIVGSSNASGVMVNGNAGFLQISNNKIFNNTGNFAGGIQIGHTGSALPLSDTNAQNHDVTIHHNMITQNAGLSASGGGGVVLGTGSDGYQVTDNFIAGNLAAGQGGGIAHIGLSQSGVIDRNTVVFNESFSQGVGVSGGGVFVGGRPAIAGTLTPGSGNVRISNNKILGNQAAAGDGGGIALLGVNGTDVQTLPSDQRYRVQVFNNMITNNVAALAGGGISIQDAAYVEIVHDTIASNDSIATAGAAFTAGPNQSVPQPAGIVSRGFTPLLGTALGQSYADPLIANSIVWQNRSFYFGQVSSGIIVPGDPNPVPVQYGLIPNATQPYWEFGVLGGGAGAQLHPVSSVMTSTTGYDPSNVSTAPTFVRTYFNGDRRANYVPGELNTSPIAVPAAFDEGGNFIRPQFGPLSLESATGVLYGDYHLTSGVVGRGLNTIYGNNLTLVPATLLFDYDGQLRPAIVIGGGPVAAGPHRGADQVW